MKITLLCSDLSANGLSRTALLAEILAHDADVRIIGTYFGGELWPGARDLRIPVTGVRGTRWPRYAARITELAGMIDGDVVIARKPVLSSYGAALSARRAKNIPVVLDIDDDELAFREPRGIHRLTSLAHPNSRLTTAHYVRRTGEADAVVVASYGLQQRFGGVVVPHAKDTNALRPQPDQNERAKVALGLSARKIVMFMGSVRPHKGVEDAARALDLMRHEDAVLTVVGAEEGAYLASLKQMFPRVQFRGPFAMSEVGFLLQAADAVVVPQRDSPAGRDQLPAKLLDAMALAKPVVATTVSDMPHIVGDDRGWLVPPRDVHAMARALDAIFDNINVAARTGERARQWVIDNASYNSVRATLAGVISAAIAQREQSR